MRAVALFFHGAREDFRTSGLPGEFLGIDVEGGQRSQKGFFIHVVDGKVQRTEWHDAAGCWEGGWHALQKWATGG